MITTSSPARWRRPRRALSVPAAVLAGLLALTACGDSGSSSGAGSIAAPPQPAEFSKVVAPGPPLTNLAALKGKTVFWIPITSQAPVFSIEQVAAKDAFASVGVNLQVCDGQATPGEVSKCVNQAIAAGAAGIITSSLPPEFAQQSFSAAAAAGIPMLFVNSNSAPAEWGDKAAVLPPNFVQQAHLNNDLIVADSGGKGKVLLVGVTDSSATTVSFDEGMQKYLTEKCSGCKVDAVQTNSTQMSQLTSLVSAALVKNPDTQYVFVQFDAVAAPVVQAIRQLNKTSSIKLLALRTQLDGMQRVADGSQFADTGDCTACLGWNEADAMLRMMQGQKVDTSKYVTPIKTYTSANIKGADISQAGWESGKWQTTDDFRALYKKLWGATA